MHVACPQCGTGYTLKPEMLERPRLRLRCRRCRLVWDPRPPVDGPDAPAVVDPEPAAEAPPPAAEEAALAEAVARALEEDAAPPAPRPATPRPPRRRLAAMLYGTAAVLVLVSVGGIGWAYRDRLPFAAPAMPELSEVEPAWRDDGDGRRLIVSAQVANPSARPTEVRLVRVKFLSARGAWIDERLVEVPAVTVPPGESSALEMAVERLPDGTAALELSVVSTPPVS